MKVSTNAVLAVRDLDSDAPFRRGSAIRRVVGEPVMALALERALVMCVAHPKVAAAVKDHSRFRRQPVGRLWVTVDAALRLVFGSGRVPTEAAEQIYRTHDRINGWLPAADGTSDEAYTAHDVTLLVWVWAALVDSCTVAYTRWVAPWSAGEADAFYDDMCTFARFFGIPEPVIPSNRGHFAAYLEEMVSGGELGSTEASRQVAAEIVSFSRWYAPRPVLEPLRRAALATLDSRLRQALGLVTSERDQQAFERLERFLAAFYHHLPGWRVNLPYLYLSLRQPVVGFWATWASRSLGERRPVPPPPRPP
ncbi:MAG: DUF2236 domain-containing protein [Actinobacteria bacterium]|nr:DUF2236 domain-containing protein [Actinomycetota bacterium]